MGRDNSSLKETKRIRNFFFPFRWIYIPQISLWTYCTFFSEFSKSDGILSAIIIYSILFILPIIAIELCVKLTKKKTPRKREKERKPSDKYISPLRITGFVFLALTVVFVFIGISLNADPETYLPNNMYPGYTFGAVCLILLALSAKDPKTITEYEEREKAKIALKEAQREKAEYEKRMRAYRGVYLTEQEIRNLENEIELPNLDDTSVFLGPGEVAVYHSAATRQEIKNRVVGRTGGYSGGTIHIAKGVSIRTGSSSSRPVYGDVATHYEGELVLTNKRMIFISNQKAFEVSYNSITAATAYSDGISIQSKNHTYTLLLPKAELAVIAFNAVRTGEIPIADTTEYDPYHDNDFDFDDDMDIKFETEDPVNVSSIDGMDGFAFENFCAELLRKNGFSNVSVTPASGDQGVDILAEKSGIKYAIQCKNYSSALGNTPVQEVNSGKQFYHCHVGVVLTNSTFTSGAKKLAEATGVLLWDRTELQKMMGVVDTVLP